MANVESMLLALIKSAKQTGASVEVGYDRGVETKLAGMGDLATKGLGGLSALLEKNPLAAKALIGGGLGAAAGGVGGLIEGDGHAGRDMLAGGALGAGAGALHHGTAGFTKMPELPKGMMKAPVNAATPPHGDWHDVMPSGEMPYGKMKNLPMAFKQETPTMSAGSMREPGEVGSSGTKRDPFSGDYYSGVRVAAARFKVAFLGPLAAAGSKMLANPVGNMVAGAAINKGLDTGLSALTRKKPTGGLQ